MFASSWHSLKIYTFLFCKMVIRVHTQYYFKKYTEKPQSHTHFQPVLEITVTIILKNDTKYLK